MIVLVLVTALALRGIAASASVDLIVLAIEMLVVVALAVTIFAKGGPGLHGLQPFNPSRARGVRAGHADRLATAGNLGAASSSETAARWARRLPGGSASALEAV